MICVAPVNLYLEDDSSKWEDEENKAKDDFYRDLQTALGRAPLRWHLQWQVASFKEEFSRDH